jgi:hypothetical protein
MVDTIVKFGFLLVILVNFRVPALGYDTGQFENDAQGTLDALDNFLSSFQGDEACEYKCANSMSIHM